MNSQTHTSKCKSPQVVLMILILIKSYDEANKYYYGKSQWLQKRNIRHFSSQLKSHCIKCELDNTINYCLDFFLTLKKFVRWLIENAEWCRGSHLIENSTIILLKVCYVLIKW